MTKYDGRLELTWTNKHLRLLAHEDGSYEWVPPSDYRVAEVRLLHDVTTVGDVGKNRAADNFLIHGDALNALTSLSHLPEFSNEQLGNIKLAYLDPPFNTQQSFLHYDDALEHSVWLTMMRDRLLQIRDLLAHDGTVWLHLDDAEVHRARIVMDEVFGPTNFVSTVIWEKVYSPRMDAKQFSSSNDSLLIYSKNPEWHPNKVNAEVDERQFNQIDEAGQRYRLRSLRKEGKGSLREDRPNLWYAIKGPDGNDVWPVKPDGTEGRWRWGEDHYLSAMEEVEWVQQDGGYHAFLKQYAESSGTRPPETIWLSSDVGHNHEAVEHLKKLLPNVVPFGTPKPERLLRRIIEISTNPGDTVLDCFAGSGTTAAVAHKMGRRWIAVERESSTIESFTLPRLRKVVEGDDPGGITTNENPAMGDLPDGVKPGAATAAAKVLNAISKSGLLDDDSGVDEDAMKTIVKFLRSVDKSELETVWHGGGGFRMLDVAPSMFEADSGLVFLADWMTNGILSEATAAQLGFQYEDTPPFSGRKGRTRLAVVDGVVNESVVRLIASALPERERVVVCGTGIDTDARPILRELRPGSTLRKIPAALLDEYRSARQLRFGITDASNNAESTMNTDILAEELV